ncbi:hybrid sensor histidine kinase/response regulator [Desulfococcaceae bacterium OttesenSCG-928-F15]|nr:hybrid sensor histidine kinase/response regulator [Desulfococcaceae bacterium OttesenSCG-928-F15]
MAVHDLEMKKTGGKKTGDEPFCRIGSLPALLLVDDEKAFADTLALRLETGGMPSLVAYSGEEALSLMNRPELEVVLLDLNMPGMHGLEILSLMKEKRPDVEVLLLTGEADLGLAARGMRRGAGDYLLKPVDFASLLESIAKARKRSWEHKERLRAAEAGKLMALGALAAGVGHEINNPLQVIMQRSEWLQELVENAAKGNPNFAEMAETAEIIQKQAARAGAITAQLLHLARRSLTGKAETRLPELIARVIGLQKERAGREGIALVADIAENLPVLHFSPAEFEPVLTHLLDNAMDALAALSAEECAGGGMGNSQGRVHIHVARVGDMVRIVVSDTGEGISSEYAPHIFDPFFSTRPVGHGTGLGLTVCHSIVTALRGRLSFIPAVPRGAIFIVELPVTDEEEEP